MNTFNKKRDEWHQQGQSTSDLKAQVCRPVDEKIWQALITDIRDKLQLKQNNKLEKILDIGCGNALVLSQFKDDFTQLYGIDYGKSMIANAKEILPGGIFSTGEAAQLNFSTQYFDRVLSYSIFHYFPNQAYIYQAIDEMLRVTKKGGVILIGDLLDKQFEQEIKTASDMIYEEKLPFILRYSQWTFCDLAKLITYFQAEKYQDKITNIEILTQPEHFALRHYRKDLRICC